MFFLPSPSADATEEEDIEVLLLWLTADARAVHEEVGSCLHPQ